MPSTEHASSFASRERMHSFLFDYVASQTGLFLLSDLVSAARAQGLGPAAPAGGSKGKRLRRDPLATVLSQILESEGLAFPEPDNVFMPVAAFFKDAEFLISPTTEELSQGILVPGHRFVPFLRSEILPWNVMLTGPNGKAAPTRKVEEKLSNLRRYFTFFSPKRTLNLLALDDEENSRRYSDAEPDKVRVTLTIFDMNEAFESLGFREGDALRCRLDSWQEGRIAYGKVGAEELAKRKAEQDAWVASLEASLRAGFESEGPMPVEDQLARGLYRAGRSLLRNPPLHFGGFLSRSASIKLHPFGDGVTFWHAGSSPGDAIQWTEEPEPLGLDGSLDDILSDIGCALSSGEIEAYMRDQLFSRRGGLSEVVARMLSGRMTVFHGQAQRKAFDRFLNDLWSKVNGEYNFFSDQKVGTLRKRVMAVLDRHLAWIRGMEEGPEGLSPDLEDRLMSAVAPSQMLSGIAIALNRTKDSELEGSVGQELQKALEGLEAAFSDIEEGRARRPARRPSPPARTSRGARKRKRKKRPSLMMVLKVALKDISPQIVRRIAVPDTFTLGDLHLMIQAAMGWTTSHLHAFVINGTEYSDPDDVESGDVDFIDEREVTLAKLIHSPRKSFIYIYDFGDNWRHAVTVERFIPLAPDSSSSPVKPACLSGKRACPPEDCGSIPGYYRLVGALECPVAERTEEMRESIEWAGDWDPERFNLDDANQRIASIFQGGIPPG